MDQNPKAMTAEERKILLQKNTDDFNIMRGMLSDIERNIMQADPLRQLEYYQPLQAMILEAWQDSGDPYNTFLFPPVK